jgi:hypothetical protein
VKAARPRKWRQSVPGKAADEDGRGEPEGEMSKTGEVDSSLCERPGHHRPRRLVDWINPTRATKVHSFIGEANHPCCDDPCHRSSREDVLD